MLTNRAQPLRSETDSAWANFQAAVELAPKVADLALAHEQIEGREHFVDGRVGVEAMDLVEIDHVDAQPLEARLATLLDVLAREARHVGAGAHFVEHLGGHDALFEPGILAQRLPVTSSLAPSEYMSAVSKKLMPLSTARRKKGMAACWSSTQGRQAGSP